MARPIIALLYDFDKTLCTTDMENYTFIPALGYTPAQFWQKANGFGRDNHMDGLLAYMYTMIHECPGAEPAAGSGLSGALRTGHGALSRRAGVVPPHQ